MTELNLPTADRGQDGAGSTIVPRLRPRSRSSIVLLTLKGMNAALTAISNFVLAYVLVRAIGLNSYAVMASLLAIAALVLQSDLGITGLAFFKLRANYLAATGGHGTSPDDRALVMTIVTIYVAIGVISVVVLAAAIATNLVQVNPYGLPYLLIFAGAVCALPRMALRSAINARDGFVSTEFVDLGRRIAILVATAAMLLGLPFASYSAINLLVWLSSVAILIWLAQSYGFAVDGRAFSRGLKLLRREVRGIRATVLLSLTDFIISVFPYYLLAATRDAAAIVAFDMFYKVTRFAAMTYLIGAETALPQQTRAVHHNDAAGLARATGKGLLIGLLPMAAGIAGIALFGEKIFRLVLGQGEIVSPAMRFAICAMLVFMLIQTTCQIVLIGTGKFEELARRAGITFVGMVAISASMVLFHWSIDAFILGYVIVYGAGSLLYAECFYSLNRSLRGQELQSQSKNVEGAVEG